MQKYLLGLWIFLLVACQEERLEQGLQSGFLIALSEIESEVETRTAPADLPDPVKTEFKVTIRNQETDKQQTVKWSEEVVPAEPGTYTLTAEFGENPDLGFDQPYYKGEKTDQTVRDGYTKEVSIPCEVANALVSIRIKEEDQAEFEKNFPDAYVKISVGSVKDQMWTDLNTSAYFKAGSTLSQLILYKGHETGELDLLKEAGATVPKSFQAKDHLIITLGLQGQNGNLSLVVEKAEIKEETISETIPMEWLPRPKVEAEGFEGNQLSFVETETKAASIRLVTAAALQDLKLKFNFEDEQFQSSLQKEKEYILSNAEDKQAVETALGITLPTIGTKEASLDLSPLLSKLQTNAGVATINSIEIDAKANNRWSSEEIEGQETPNLKYTLVCNKPEFTVSAYPGNIWTKEFTMNALMEEQVTKGNFAKLSADMKYQFSIDGESGWTDLGEDLRKADLTPGTTYYVRGVYRGVVCSEPVAVSTYPVIELENGGLEEPFIIDGNDSGITRGSVYGWSGWATLNEISTPSGITAYSFNSRSGCRPTSDAKQGNAIRVITLGYGIGGFAKPKNAMHSKLYLGVSADKNGNGVVNGIEYRSRPQGLSFWYKCISNKGNDQSLVRIQLLHDDVILGEGELMISATNNDYLFTTIMIDYSPYINNKFLDPNKLTIMFQSGTKEPLSIDDDLKSFIGKWDTTDRTEDATFRGNELYVDEVSLVYDK